MVNAPAPPVGSSSHSIRRSCSPRSPASSEPTRATDIESHVPKESSMTIDLEMAAIAKVFFQESREGLDVMESGLLSLGATADSENINTIFRAAHSIKGGSATFGFAEVAGFTHGVETLLDEMRNGVRPVTAEAIQTLLQACDCLREMIAATEAEQPLDQVRIASLNGDIKHILGEAIEAPAPVLTPARAEGNEAAGTGAASEPGGWRGRFEPGADLLRLRNEPTRTAARRPALPGKKRQGTRVPSALLPRRSITSSTWWVSCSSRNRCSRASPTASIRTTWTACARDFRSLRAIRASCRKASCRFACCRSALRSTAFPASCTIFRASSPRRSNSSSPAKALSSTRPCSRRSAIRWYILSATRSITASRPRNGGPRPGNTKTPRPHPPPFSTAATTSPRSRTKARGSTKPKY